MLVLTRRAGESIIIDDRLELKVLRIRGNQVHIGINAPRETPIFRKEIWERMQLENGTPLPESFTETLTENHAQAVLAFEHEAPEADGTAADHADGTVRPEPVDALHSRSAPTVGRDVKVRTSITSRARSRARALRQQAS